jgi:hypothetical protein
LRNSVLRYCIFLCHTFSPFECDLELEVYR